MHGWVIINEPEHVPARAVSVGQYKLDYFVKKYDLTTIQARVILAKAGSNRDKANAAAPSRHRTQYFEMMGVQGLYNDGWMLSAVPIRPPWDLAGKAIDDPATAFKMELYNVQSDWTQSTDVAAAKALARSGPPREQVGLDLAPFGLTPEGAPR